MFADDVALITDTVCGLQRQLNALRIFCKDNRLNVNTKKTKIVIFRNGGRPSSKEKWLYEGNELLIEQSFTYVGITFSSALSLNRMAEDNCVKGKRALNSILASMCNFGQLPNTVFFKLFDTKVFPILLYGAELWDFQTRTGVERI